jgi:Mce-associated membrane protein
MAENSRPRRPVVGSRNPTGRPRKVAGQRPDPEEPVADEPVVEEPVVDEPVVDEPVVEQAPTGSTADDAQTPEADAGSPPPKKRGIDGARTTVALVVTLVLLIGIGAFEVLYLASDDEPAASAERPVVTGELTHRAAVEAAARSTEQILSTSYKNYDEQVDQATSKMTDAFAQQYRQTSDGIKDQFVASEAELQVKAVAQGVVRASSDEVEALLFLNQYVQKKRPNGEPKTDYAQYRALVTVLHTNQGWLVSSIKTE